MHATNFLAWTAKECRTLDTLMSGNVRIVLAFNVNYQNILTFPDRVIYAEN